MYLIKIKIKKYKIEIEEYNKLHTEGFNFRMRTISSNLNPRHGVQV